ncbi:MAG: hypothetical protein GVY31_08845 [Alphaproteobacteria bacterium]|nr:hypothetical protein [Alphaproteobacteria bacterium]
MTRYRLHDGPDNALLWVQMAPYPLDGASSVTLADCPQLHQVCMAMVGRPMARGAARAEGVAETPFPVLRPANPPKGSAT